MNSLLRRRMMIQERGGEWDSYAVQTLRSDKPNYNPAVAIILQGKGLGEVLESAPYGQGRYTLTKVQAFNAPISRDTFAQKTTLTDTNGIVTADTAATYDFESFDEFQYFSVFPFASRSKAPDGFYQCSKLKSIIIPPNITSIPIDVWGHGAFCDCTALERVVLNNVSEISSYCFKWCNKLTFDEFPSRITSIPMAAFGSCTALNFTNLGNVTEITRSSNYDGAFSGCTNLANTLTDLPATLTYIGESSFRNIRFRYLHLLSPFKVELQSLTLTFDGGNYKIYVGNGESQASDGALLALYLADSVWSGISSRLATWWSYLHP